MLSFLRRLRRPVPAARPSAPAWPTVFHVTHHKAGSQWIHRILHYCAPERVVTPRVEGVHLFEGPVRPGTIYPTVYRPRHDFDRVALPAGSRRFVVIRDLRDTLVSWYFSLKVSHVIDCPAVADWRREFRARSEEDGLLLALEHPRGLARMAEVQRSWLESGERLFHVEDLLARDEELIPWLLLEHCGMPLPRELVLNAVRDTRFERLSGGRPRGVEDVRSHYRKGVAGDWRNHFTPRVKAAFKARFGGLLAATGYGQEPDW